MYLFAKHLHMTAVALSIILFLLRFGLLSSGSQMLSKKWLKISPHVIDTVLLASAVWLCVILQLNPLAHDWLWQKIFAVIIYIGLGFYVLKAAKNPLQRGIGFVLALAALAIAVKLVMTRQGLF